MSVRKRKALQFVDADKLYPSTNCGMASLSRSIARGKLHALSAGIDIARQELLALFTRNLRRPWLRRWCLPHEEGKAALYSGFVLFLTSTHLLHHEDTGSIDLCLMATPDNAIPWRHKQKIFPFLITIIKTT